MNVVSVGRECWHCHKTEDRALEIYKRCGNCLEAIYCSRECQKSDYKGHKKFCAEKLEERKKTLQKDTMAFVEKVREVGKKVFSSAIEDFDKMHVQREYKKLIAEKECILKEALSLYGERSAFVSEVIPLSQQLDFLNEKIQEL